MYLPLVFQVITIVCIYRLGPLGPKKGLFPWTYSPILGVECSKQECANLETLDFEEKK
jgi:hypothetical protein